MENQKLIPEKEYFLDGSKENTGIFKFKREGNIYFEPVKGCNVYIESNDYPGHIGFVGFLKMEPVNTEE